MERLDSKKEPMTESQVAEALAAIERDGFVVLPGVVDDERLGELAAALQTRYDELVQRGQMFTGGGTVSGHLNCYPGAGARFVYEALDRAGVLDIARTRDPDAFDRLRVTMNFNLPGSHDQHYHADGLYVEEFLIFNVAVVDTDLVNGAIDMLPATHRRFYRFWEFCTHRLWRRSTRIQMSKGDVLVRLSTTWHRGMHNGSERARPMLSFTFGEVSAPYADPFVMNGGGITFFPNWYSTNRKGQLKEQAFVSVPYLYSTLRLGRSLVGKKGYATW